MTAHETEAVTNALWRLVDELISICQPECADDASEQYTRQIAEKRFRPILLALLATPQPTQTDIDRAIAHIKRWYHFGSDRIDPRAEDVVSLSAEFAAVRAEGTEWRDVRQKAVSEWCAAAFGADHAASVPQRGIRHVEEAIEAAQAAGCERGMLHKLVDYVFDRPVGDLRQEIGGSGLTLLALAQAAGYSADEAERAEIARVKAKPLEHFTKRNHVKNEAGFDTASPPQP